MVSLNLGWHHYFDKNVNWYNNSQDLLKHDTNDNYDKTAPATEAIQYKETYTRTNRVLGLGVQVDF